MMDSILLYTVNVLYGTNSVSLYNQNENRVWNRKRGSVFGTFVITEGT